MSIEIIRGLLETALAAITPAIDTAWENVTFNPTPNTPYQAVNLLLADPENPTFSSPATPGFTRELGIFQITLRYPQGVGPASCYARAQLLRDTFFRGKSFTATGLTLIVNRTPTISPGRVDGDRWAVPVKISFFANVYG